MEPTRLAIWTLIFSIIIPLSVKASRQLYFRRKVGPIGYSLVLGILWGLLGWLTWLGVTRGRVMLAFRSISPFFISISILSASVLMVGTWELSANLILDSLLPGAASFLLAVVAAWGGLRLEPALLLEGGYRSLAVAFLVSAFVARIAYWYIKGREEGF